MDPNMLDISCAGHLSSGDDSLSGAIRELKEELDLDVLPEELVFLCTYVHCTTYLERFIDNEFDDVFLLRTSLSIEEMTYQKEEISEIFFVPYLKFKDMVMSKQEDLVLYPEEYSLLFSLLDKKVD